MANKQEINMVLKVDLDCTKCSKKIKKVLSKFSQTQDPEYDEKQGTVKIKVACVSPEKIKKELMKKGGKVIKGIDIVKLESEKTETPSQAETQDDNSEGQVVEKPVSPPRFVTEEYVPQSRPVNTHCLECYREGSGGRCMHGSGYHPPSYPSYNNEAYGDGAYGGSRPVWNDSHVAQNDGQCRIM